MDADSGKRRPVFLNLLRIRMPVMAIVSIGHRASGILLFLLTPVLIALFERSLSGPAGFSDVAGLFARVDVRLALLVGTWALAHHFFAGLRYLALDLDIGVDRAAARRSAWIVHACAVLTVIAVAAGWWL